jgi:TonB-dependent receptor
MKLMLHPHARLLAVFAIGFAPCGFLASAIAQAQAPAATAQAESGMIEGRVFNAGTGGALARARVTVEGTQLETFTDETGSFRLVGVPSGEARIAVSYIGMNAQTAAVTVAPGLVVRREFELTRGAEAARPGGEVVRLQEFNVVADREMSAQAVAMNEQRYAANIKNVVALDEYGDQGEENVLSFLRFLPGVSIADDAPTAGSVSMRGFPGNNTDLTVDGAEFASSRTSGTRTTVLVEVPLANISRIEVTKVPTPDMPASGLGGSINLISKNGFETRRPLFTYQVSTMFFSETGLSLRGEGRNQIGMTSPNYIQPSFSLSYLRPINRSLAINAGFSRTWRQTPARHTLAETPTWNLASLIQTTSDRILVTRVLQTTSGKVGADWRITSRDTLSTSIQYRETFNVTTGDRFLIAYGAGATGGATFTQGAATGVGTATQQSRANQNNLNKNAHVTLRYKHEGDTWRIGSSAAYSFAKRHLRDIDSGFFSTTPSTIANLVIRGDDIGNTPGGNLPTRYSAVTRAGAPVDLYDGRNYTLNSATSDQDKFQTTKTSASFDIAREFSSWVPITLKTGLAATRNQKETRRFQRTWTFRPNGAADEASRLAGKFDIFDEAYNATGPTLYGKPVRWISSPKVFALYQQHPDWFVVNESTYYQGLVNNSTKFDEIVSAAFLRTDVRLLQKRFWLVAGARLERTDVEGWGPLNDIFAEYQRDANGDFIRNAAGQRILITTDTLARTKLRFKERGAHAKSDYSGLYPSLNTTFNISEQLVLRAAYARTIGRPEVSTIVPGTTISDPEATNPTIVVSNPGLKPWTSDGFDLSLESYFLKDGFGSIGVFQKSIKNFFGAVTTPATRELLAAYGLPDDDSLLDYDITTETNAGDAKVKGVEFNYRQSLTFLPRWARGLQIFANGTKMELDGSSTANFTSFSPKSVAGGINLIRSRYLVKLTMTHQGLTRRALVTPSATVPANTYNYLPARTILSVSAQYSLSKRFALYGAFNDIGGGSRGTFRFAPGTPEYARRSAINESGWYSTVGVKGEF